MDIDGWAHFWSRGLNWVLACDVRVIDGKAHCWMVWDGVTGVWSLGL